ncbi:MAG: alpha/beta hydrolase [Bacteroidetes bacterium]|nr:alpha/beta hydrolase [Bacteroidota bacterium]MBS1931785.1 alpha/beta hydrolase [Bacteroidota bacterium]
MKKNILIVLLVFSSNFSATKTFSQNQKVTKHENVIYGMISGMALLMDVYQPEKSNHLGIVYIIGSGFGASDYYKKIYNQVPLKDDYYLDTAYSGKWIRILNDKGYTVFVINHRFAPRFHYPDIFYDCQRAVRFIRYNANQYQIDARHIGAMGHSSGAYLSAMLGVTDTLITHPENPMDSMSSKVQAVVTLAAPFVLSEIGKNFDTLPASKYYLQIALDYIGELPEIKNNEFILSAKYAQASPISYVTADDAPIMVYYSENDPIIPPRQAVMMCKKLKEAGVPFKEIHNPDNGHEPLPDMQAVDNWFKKYLK